MNRFEHISIKGYRRLNLVQLDMRDLTVMIGANGTGKTSFLDIFALLAASASGGLLDKVGGSLSEMMTRDGTDRLAFGLTMGVPNAAPLKYQLELTPRGQSYEISFETLTQQTNMSASEPFKHIESRGVNVKYYSSEEKRLISPVWEHNPYETSLSQAPKMYQVAENMRKQLASSTFYGPLDVAPKSLVRLPQSMRPATLPGRDGGELVSCLYYLRETDRDRFAVIEDTLSAAFSDFETLNFPPVAAGLLSMTWKDRNFTKPFYMHELSEGTLRFLWLLALLQSRDLTAITLIDEPEVSLHPDLLRLLADTMREASKRTQLIVATHSDRLIRFLQPKEVLVCNVEEGMATLEWADSLDLEKWLSDYTLDQLWAMNLIGGRP